MRKILLVLVSVLLMAGICYAIDADQGAAAEYGAQNLGRAVVTESSVLLKIWSPSGAANPGIGVSSSTAIVVYSNIGTQVGYTIDSRNTATDTVGEVVDYINTNFASDSTVNIRAAVGADARRSSATTALDTANIVTAATNADDTTAYVYSQSNGRVSVGVEAKDGVINRIKQVSCQLPNGYSATGSDGVTITVYNGDTRVWRKYSTGTELRTAADTSNSGNTVNFPLKGISATKGNSIMVEAVGDDTSAGTTAAEKTQTGISIVYDQLRQ